MTGRKTRALQVGSVVPNKALGNLPKALHGTTGGTCSARVFRPVMNEQLHDMFVYVRIHYTVSLLPITCSCFHCLLVPLVRCFLSFFFDINSCPFRLTPPPISFTPPPPPPLSSSSISSGTYTYHGAKKFL